MSKREYRAVIDVSEQEVNSGEDDMGRSSVSSCKHGIRGLPRQAYFIVAMTLVLALGRNIALPYLWMYLAGGSANGGLQFDSALIGFIIMVGNLSYILSILVTGGLSDRFGRKRMMAASLVLQMIIVTGYAYAKTFDEFLTLYVLFNVVVALYDPALSATVADLVQPDNREEAFGFNYMMTNVGVVVGSIIGGIIVTVSGYPVLFLYMSAFVMIGASILLLIIKEPHPRNTNKTPQPRLTTALHNRLLTLFCFTGLLTQIVYSQLSGLLSVYTEYVGFPPYVYTILLSLNGAMPVALQIPIRKGAIRLGPTRAFILGQLLFTAGFSYFMFAVDLYQFMLGVAVLTLGEITFFPTSSGFVANLAPSDMRGRYMSLSGLFFRTGAAIGPQISFIIFGILVDKRLVWGTLGLIGLATLPGYVALLWLTRRRRVSEKSAATTSHAVGQNKINTFLAPASGVE